MVLVACDLKRYRASSMITYARAHEDVASASQIGRRAYAELFYLTLTLLLCADIR